MNIIYACQGLDTKQLNIDVFIVSIHIACRGSVINLITSFVKGQLLSSLLFSCQSRLLREDCSSFQLNLAVHQFFFLVYYRYYHCKSGWRNWLYWEGWDRIMQSRKPVADLGGPPYLPWRNPKIVLKNIFSKFSYLFPQNVSL